MILVTGINGEIGVALVKTLYQRGFSIIGLDLKKIRPEIATLVKKSYQGDITDKGLVENIFKENQVTTVYHLAAILSTQAEVDPMLAHRVNVDGFLNLIHSIIKQEQRVKFFFPSSIAVYSLEDKSILSFSEKEYCQPNNVYGCNKLYCEQLGLYFSRYREDIELDFRAIRFPGIISSETLPQGGTSDYAPEMIHWAVQNKHYHCFVRSDSCIPFMVMPDAVKAINQLMEAPPENLSSHVYHIQAFSPTVKDILDKIRIKYPHFNLSYQINMMRQRIIDSWPSCLDQSLAEKDWGWQPSYGFDAAFDEYLIPTIERFYKHVS